MSYSLNEFCDDTRSILNEHDDHSGRDRVRVQLERLLNDSAFCGTYLGSASASGVRQIFEDPELHFCVLAYNMDQPRSSPPHDHGETWAVYGQAAGHTDMTIWSAEDDGIKPVGRFRLEPGQAGLFDVREIHSIEYTAGAKFVRVTGMDMSRQPRRVYDPETGSVREVERVAAGDAQASPADPG